MASKEYNPADTAKQTGAISAIEIFQPLIIRAVNAEELIASSKLKQIIGDDVVKGLRRSKTPNDQRVNTILELISQSTSLDKWKTFAGVLTDCDFTFVPLVIIKHYPTSVELQLNNVVDKLKDETVDTALLSGILETNSLLTDIDVQDIDTERINRQCEKAALLVLIDRVVTFHPDSWYQNFLKCLCEAGMEGAVKKIEPDFGTYETMSDTKHNNEMESVTTDDHWRKLIMELCYGQIVKNVTPTGLLTNLGSVFNMDEKTTIRSLQKMESSQAAMAKLLNILDKKDCPGKWQIFKQALVEDGYAWIKDFIEGNFICYGDSDNWELMINFFEGTLSEKIRPQEILPHLRQENIISDIDSQEVEQVCRNYGENEAVFRLLTFLPKRKPNSWYPEFMEILFKTGCEETVGDIDPDIYKSTYETMSDTKHNNEMESVTTDDHWRKLIMELCYGQIVKNVTPTGLLTNLGSVFNMDEKTTIRSLQKMESSQAAMAKLLNILDKKDCPGKWQIFKQALSDGGYAWIKDFIEGNFICYGDSDNWELMINFFEGTLSEKIRPQEILPHLRQENIISDIDSQEVEQVCRNYGENEAVFRLLTFLPKRKPNSWYPEFMEILFKTGCEETVGDIDPDIYKKLIRNKSRDTSASEEISNNTDIDSLKEGADKNMDESDIKENYVSVTEDPETAGTNLCSEQNPSNLNTDKDDEITKQKLLAKTKVDQSYNMLSDPEAQPDSGQTELNSIIVENAKREIACEVSHSEEDKRNIECSQLIRNKSRDTSASEEISNNTDINSLKEGADKNMDESDIKENYVSVTEDPETAGTNLCSEQNPSNLNTDKDDEITKQKLLAKTKVDQSYNMLSDPEAQPDSGQTELNSIIVENAKREIALEVSHSEEDKRNIECSPYDTVRNDDSDSDSDNENIATEVLKLRNYQKELADPALQGKNCIIVAPTGSGKTYVALEIIQDHMEKVKSRFPKVVILVGQSALAQQHADQCKKFLSQYRVKLITGEIKREAKLAKALSSWLNRRDILVVTAQILVNAMRDNDIKIEDFTLMVFDECHHAQSNHAYTQIMDKYMDLKLDENIDLSKLPMIVGFTASVGVGRTSTEQGAEKHIQKMMANLDAEELVTVKECLPELSEHVTVPEQEIVQTKGRNKNYFGETIVQIMESIEKYMIESKYASSLPDNGGILKGPADKGSDPYVQWISRLWRETAKINNQDARRYFETCRLYLELYNKVLIIYEDAQVKDSMQYLEEKLRLINDGVIKDETDTKMMNIYQKGRPVLSSCVGRTDHDNPKLEDLKEIIFRLYRDQPESRVIVLIKTRDLVQAIENWMKETDGLSCLNPVKFVGAQASEEKGGMTKSDQDDILKLFKTGRHKIIIATSVVEEGIDIQTCNLVIKYDHVTNEIAMVQGRGRARAVGSKCILLASEKRGTAEKEEINIMREVKMNEAIKKVQEKILHNKDMFMIEVKQIQQGDKRKRNLEKLKKKTVTRTSEFVLRCGKCSTYICMSSDIKKIQDAHHAVINEEVRNCITTPRSTAKRIDSLITIGVGKVKCKKCGQELGNITIHKGAEFPVLKIDNFLVADSAAKTNVYKRWKSVPFRPEALTEEDLANRLQGQPYVQD